MRARKAPNVFPPEGKYASAAFQGIMRDNGAAKVSTAGH
jgi:hypothetical protein